MNRGVTTRSQKRRDIQEGKNTSEMENAQRANDDISSVLHGISQEIRDFRAENKVDLHALKEELKEDMKKELQDLKQEIYQNLSANTARIQANETRLSEAETRISEIESVNTAMKEALVKSMERQKTMQEKLTDMEGRSRRNNIRVYGVPEGKEGDSVPDFMDQLLKSELALTADMNLKIQHAHRASARKPEKNQPPRVIVVNFMEFNTKEAVLKKAWGKKIMIEGQRLSFDHDYATEVVQKRKAYTGIKKLLKEKGIRFQTPLDKMRIHWDSGTRTYGSAREAAQELKKTGYSVEVPGSSTAEPSREMEQLLRAPVWQRAGETSRDAAQRARERLQEFERTTPN